MVPHVFGVGYAYNEYEVTAGRWKEFEIEFDYADNIKQAAAMLSFKEWVPCIRKNDTGISLRFPTILC